MPEDRVATAPDDTSALNDLCAWVTRLLDTDVPGQFLHLTAIDTLNALCAALHLPEATNVAGNAVVGELESARYVLSAHIDEASFNVIDVDQTYAWLAACHRFVDAEDDVLVRLLGVRNGIVQASGPVTLMRSGDSFRCDRRDLDVRLGDRAVYATPIAVRGDTILGKAVDDRCGAVIALCAAAHLRRLRVPVAVVLSDGEQSCPDGYFSRNFPHVLRRLSASCTIVFVDGIFQGDIDPNGRASAPTTAFVVPHTSRGKGYTVPPRLFAWLRDVAVPDAQRRAIDVHVSSAYHSRGDDWGLVTNPTSGRLHAAFLVSFGGKGSTPARREVHMASIEHARSFLVHVVGLLEERGDRGLRMIEELV